MCSCRLTSSYIVISPVLFFFPNDSATTEIYTLSLHDALPISRLVEALDATDPILGGGLYFGPVLDMRWLTRHPSHVEDRKSTRLNSSHVAISYAVFCLKKKKHDFPP